MSDSIQDYLEIWGAGSILVDETLELIATRLDGGSIEVVVVVVNCGWKDSAWIGTFNILWRWETGWC